MIAYSASSLFKGFNTSIVSISGDLMMGSIEIA
jgi:hypothetical protein